MSSRILAPLALALAAWVANPACGGPGEPLATESYRAVVEDTVAMVRDPVARKLAAKHGLTILDVTWEDTGRFEGSSLGPNISDMTIQVHLGDPRTGAGRLVCMPVIRFPNFSDRSADLDPARFFLLVGNEKGRELEKVSLKELLGDLRRFLHDPSSWKGSRTSLAADRDTHVLVSAQACFLPIPPEGGATFNPVLFNYQSSQGDPAVLTLLATREGTSVTVIDNTRDAYPGGGGWGQRLFFNKDGERAAFTGQRLSDFVREGGAGWTGAAGQASPEAAGQAGLNMVLLIQVPLVHQGRGGYFGWSGDAKGLAYDDATMPRARSDVEAAVIGHGKVEGPFTEIDGLEIERDPRFPVRVTVQFYKATSNGVVSEADLAEIAAQIGKVYAEADYVGSLVVDGRTGRPTEHTGPRRMPVDWWPTFWQHHHGTMIMDEEQAVHRLEKALGEDWRERGPEACREVLQEYR